MNNRFTQMDFSDLARSLALICYSGSRKLCNFETHFKVPFSSFLPLSPFSILSHSASFCGGAFPLEANFRFPKFGETQIRLRNCKAGEKIPRIFKHPNDMM